MWIAPYLRHETTSRHALRGVAGTETGPMRLRITFMTPVSGAGERRGEAVQLCYDEGVI
jgi:hypothetical protein